MRITWLGTASLSVDASSGRLLIDPFLPLVGSETSVLPSAFQGYNTILVTHGHFDHIMSLPKLVRGARTLIYCTETPRQTLLKKGILPEQLLQISPGDRFEVEGMTVTAFQGRHIRYDGPVLRRTLLNRRMLKYARNLPKTVREVFACPENGETLGYLIEADGRRLFAMGSLGFDPSVEYPSDVDLLTLPYQGSSRLLEAALPIVERIRPKAVLLTHFDDTFPPISASIDTADIEAALRGRMPVTRLCAGQSMEI